MGKPGPDAPSSTYSRNRIREPPWRISWVSIYLNLVRSNPEGAALQKLGMTQDVCGRRTHLPSNTPLSTSRIPGASDKREGRWSWPKRASLSLIEVGMVEDSKGDGSLRADQRWPAFQMLDIASYETNRLGRGPRIRRPQTLIWCQGAWDFEVCE